MIRSSSRLFPRLLQARSFSSTFGLGQTATPYPGPMTLDAGEEGDDYAMAIFDEMDANGDGVISREEFRVAIEKMRYLDLDKMKKALYNNDIGFNHHHAVMGRRVIVTDEFDSWQFVSTLPFYRHVKHLAPRSALPPKESDAPEYTLVLDMDETLLHSSPDPPSDDNPPDHTFPVTYQGSTFPVHAWLRPNLQEFLDKICGNYEVVIFTAAEQPYADVMLDILDPENKYFQHRLYRDSCMELQGTHIKDLNCLDRDLARTMLVDNSPYVFAYQLDNGIPISSWFSDKQDTELQKLEWFLRQIDGDVRSHIRNKFECYKLVSKANTNF